jgi:hypothetical protein
VGLIPAGNCMISHDPLGWGSSAGDGRYHCLAVVSGGKLPVPARPWPPGTIFGAAPPAGATVRSARVSSTDQHADRERHGHRLRACAHDSGSCGIPRWCGWDVLEAALTAAGRYGVVRADGDGTDDLRHDVLDIRTSAYFPLGPGALAQDQRTRHAVPRSGAPPHGRDHVAASERPLVEGGVPMHPAGGMPGSGAGRPHRARGPGHRPPRSDTNERWRSGGEWSGSTVTSQCQRGDCISLPKIAATVYGTACHCDHRYCTRLRETEVSSAGGSVSVTACRSGRITGRRRGIGCWACPVVGFQDTDAGRAVTLER